MKRKTILTIALFAALAVSIPNLHSLPTGAPTDGRTGSPGDGFKTCSTSGCHSGAVTDVSTVLTSNVPTEGYTPGASYTITVTVDGTGWKGFCVSPQKTDGSLVGSLLAGPGNQVAGLKYVTHLNRSSSSPAVWTFTWVAPAAGSGTVNFYGAFANNRDRVRKTIFAISEKASTGVNENAAISHLSLYPNPAVSKVLNLGFEMKKSGNLRISLLDISGKEVSILNDSFMAHGNFEEQYTLPDLSNGIYFLRIEANQEVLNRKLLIQQN